MNSSTFYYNTAHEAGVIQLDNLAMFYGSGLKFQNNFAL